VTLPLGTPPVALHVPLGDARRTCTWTVDEVLGSGPQVVWGASVVGVEEHDGLAHAGRVVIALGFRTPSPHGTAAATR
jgi:hypothetical protein